MDLVIPNQGSITLRFEDEGGVTACVRATNNTRDTISNAEYAGPSDVVVDVGVHTGASQVWYPLRQYQYIIVCQVLVVFRST